MKAAGCAGSSACPISLLSTSPAASEKRCGSFRPATLGPDSQPRPRQPWRAATDYTDSRPKRKGPPVSRTGGPRHESSVPRLLAREVAVHSATVGAVVDVPGQRRFVAVLRAPVIGDVAAAAAAGPALRDDVAAVLEPALVGTVDAIAVDEDGDIVDAELVVLVRGPGADRPFDSVVARAPAGRSRAAGGV